MPIILIARRLVKAAKKALKTDEDPDDARLVDLVKKRAVNAATGEHVVIEARDGRRHKVSHKDIHELEKKIGNVDDLKNADESQLTTKDIKLLHLLIDAAEKGGKNMLHGDQHEHHHLHDDAEAHAIEEAHEKELETRAAAAGYM